MVERQREALYYYSWEESPKQGRNSPEGEKAIFDSWFEETPNEYYRWTKNRGLDDRTIRSNASWALSPPPCCDAETYRALRDNASSAMVERMREAKKDRKLQEETARKEAEREQNIKRYERSIRETRIAIEQIKEARRRKRSCSGTQAERYASVSAPTNRAVYRTLSEMSPCRNKQPPIEQSTGVVRAGNRKLGRVFGSQSPVPGPGNVNSSIRSSFKPGPNSRNQVGGAVGRLGRDLCDGSRGRSGPGPKPGSRFLGPAPHGLASEMSSGNGGPKCMLKPDPSPSTSNTNWQSAARFCKQTGTPLSLKPKVPASGFCDEEYSDSELLRMALESSPDLKSKRPERAAVTDEDDLSDEALLAVMTSPSPPLSPKSSNSCQLLSAETALRVVSEKAVPPFRRLVR